MSHPPAFAVVVSAALAVAVTVSVYQSAQRPHPAKQRIAVIPSAGK